MKRHQRRDPKHPLTSSRICPDLFLWLRKQTKSCCRRKSRAKCTTQASGSAWHEFGQKAMRVIISKRCAAKRSRQSPNFNRRYDGHGAQTVVTRSALSVRWGGFPNSRFHTLLFGINRLRSDELLHCWAKSPCSGAFVQRLCNQNFNGLSYRFAPITSANDGASCGFAIFGNAAPK